MEVCDERNLDFGYDGTAATEAAGQEAAVKVPRIKSRAPVAWQRPRPKTSRRGLPRYSVAVTSD